MNRCFARLGQDDQVIVFRVLPHALVVHVFEYLDFHAQQKLLRGMAHERVVLKRDLECRAAKFRLRKEESRCKTFTALQS